MTVHYFEGVPMDRQFIVQSVTASLGTPIARHAKAYLATWAQPQRPSLLRGTVELRRDDGAAAGRFTFMWLARRGSLR